MANSAPTDRIRLAEALLQEAVYRSREVQATADVLAKGDVGNCGLGQKASVVLDLSPRGEELFGDLWPDGLEGEAITSARKVLAAWIQRQDALDRKRNHFLKDFRHTHGFDRAQYDADQSEAYRSGLDAINTECDDERRAAATDLLQST